MISRTASLFGQAPYDPLDPAHVGDPAARLAEARRRCPVSQPRPGVFVLAAHADVAQALRDTAANSSRNNFVLEGGTETADLPAVPITMMDDPEHAVLRARLRRWFAPAKLLAHEPRVRGIVDELLAGLAPGDQLEVWSTFGRILPARTVYALLGIPESDWQRVQAWSDVVNDHFPQVSMQMPEMAALVGYLAELVAVRSAAGADGPGVLDGLLTAGPGEQPLTPIEVVMHCLQLILAGTDTTGSLITSLLHQLLVEPVRWQRLAQDPSVIGLAVEESLRHDSPLQYVLRTAVADQVVGGQQVQAGDRLVVSLQSANLDEQRWGDDAAEFVLDRAPGSAAHIAFGSGVHNCLGAPLARMQAQILLHELVARFPGARLAAGYRWQPAARSMVRRPARLDVVL